jgi:hypothetical protein
MMHDEGTAHVTTERFALAATRIALDHVPDGPVVVVVVARVAVVLVVGALDDPGVWLHPAARNNSARAASAAQKDLCGDRLGTTAEPGGRWPRGRDGATTYRAR